jgi:hypothetical protein
MKNSPHRIKHEQKKAIRQAQKQEIVTDEKAMTPQAKERAVTSKRTNKIAKGKANPKKKSHQTSPSEVTWETEPESIHQEGSHWIKTIQKQTINKARRLQKKLQKLNFLRKKK